MKRRLASTLSLALIAAAATVFAQEDKAVELKVGDKAPNFTMTGSDGEEYTLEQYKGKKGVVIAWFPKAFTAG